MPDLRSRTAALLAMLSALAAAPAAAQDQPPTQTQDQQAALPQPTEPDTGEQRAEPTPPMAPSQLVFWSLTGVAGVALITGSIFGLAALAEEERFENSPSNQARDRGEARALAADILFGVSAATAVAAAIVLLAGDDGADEGPVTDEPRIEPSVTAGGTGITIVF